VPSTVADIFAAAGVSRDGVVRWGVPPSPPVPTSASATGIYVVALTDRLDDATDAVREAPISASLVKELLNVRPELRMDGARPSVEQLSERLAAFWFPDEVVLYIGLAGRRKSRPVRGDVSKRVADYYKTTLGARSPHAGGWPLKTLACLDSLYVHYAYCDDVDDAEDAGIERFAEHVSTQTRAGLHDRVRVMPFANLEYPQGNSKAHGITGARAPKTKKGVKPVAVMAPGPAGAEGVASPSGEIRTAVAASASWAAATPRDAGLPTTPHHRSQKVSAPDIQGGRVRIPIDATKRVLPLVRSDIEVVLRGRELRCRWDPRYGPPERSGVIGVGKGAATELLSAGDVLAVSVDDAGVVSLD
jgi:hypothetical protein